MKKEHAQALYHMGGESKEIALQYFSENELVYTRPKSWEEVQTIDGYYIDRDSCISRSVDAITTYCNKNIFPTKEYAEAALALAQLLQIKKRWFDGEIDYSKPPVSFGISSSINNEITLEVYSICPFWTHFPNKEMAEDFIAEPEIRKLLEQVKPLL